MHQPGRRGLVASGNRGNLSAAIAAGVFAIGDEHGGVGEAWMGNIADGWEREGVDQRYFQIVGINVLLYVMTH